MGRPGQWVTAGVSRKGKGLCLWGHAGESGFAGGCRRHPAVARLPLERVDHRRSRVHRGGERGDVFRSDHHAPLVQHRLRGCEAAFVQRYFE